MRDTLIAAYLDYRNNYLTVDKYAEHNGLTVIQATLMLALGLNCLMSDHPEA